MASTTCDDNQITVEQSKKRELDDDENDCQVKKLKADIVPAEEDTNLPQLPRKKKCALMMSYCGVGYAGMQINPGVRTIEQQLVNSLHLAGAITDDAKECLGKMSFQRCARTDKGVSAARQVVSLKMVPMKSLLSNINGFLPPEIRVFGMIKATKAFDCKQNCSARTYEYLCPTFAFAKDYQSTVGYRIKAEKITQINEVLSNYKGTKNYHNFTSGKKFEDPSAKRYIISFQCGEPFEREGREFIVLAVKGQSFMLHQIRKMIGLTIAVVRGVAPLATFDLAWAKKKVDIPKAPALGLILDTVHYDAYNKRFGNDGFHEPLDWGLIEEDVRKFKADYIHKHVIDTEIKQNTMMRWLNTLPSHTYTGEGMEEIGKGRSETRATENMNEAAQSDQSSTTTSDLKPCVTKDDLSAGKGATVNISSSLQNTTKELQESCDSASVDGSDFCCVTTVA